MGGGGYLLPDNKCTKTRRPIAEVLREKHPDTRVPPLESTKCVSFKEHEEVPETVPIDFTEDGVMWFTSNLSGAAGALGAEGIEMRNWIVTFE